MKRAIFAIRIAGYTAGCVGLGLVLAARRLSLGYEARRMWFGAGAGLLGLMFLCFLAGYVLHTLRLMGSHHRRD